MDLRRLIFGFGLLLSVPVVANSNGMPMGGHGGFAGGHAAAFGGWSGHAGRQGGMAHFNSSWRGGHWWHGIRNRRLGWWWVVGPSWFWFPAAVYPYPDPYAPPYLTPGYLYWCDFYQNYYPNVITCPSGWQTVEPP